MDAIGGFRLLLPLLCILLTAYGCSSITQEQAAFLTACVQPRPGEFATAARYWPETSSPWNVGRGIYGELVVTDASVRFVRCDSAEGQPQSLEFPHVKTELVYQDGSWLFLRSLPQENGSRTYTGFAIQSSVWARAEPSANEVLAEVRQRRQKLGLLVVTPNREWKNVVIVSAGTPELILASIDQSEIGEAVGTGAAAGAAGAERYCRSHRQFGYPQARQR